MDDTAKHQVEARTAEAIDQGPYEDFRQAYRDHLRWLKETNPQGFSKALGYYNDILAANIAAGHDPLSEWLEYGRTLAKLSGPGTVYRIDSTGRASAASDVSALGDVILHLPDDTRVRALPLAIPRELSAPQRATLDLLVNRKLALD
ncbi:MAG TPA: hypothetical protein VGD49_05010 [Longimicrobiales bacterium]